MPRTAYTPSLPGLTADDDLDTIINWGLGVDSTTYLAEMLTDPAAHGIDLERTAVLYMATGSEWPETRLLVEEFMLPLLREHGVRFIQLARNGHLKADGFTVLDDSRHPERLFARGPWTLWDDLESVGTVPQQAGTRKCSLWAKGAVGDWWLAQAFGGRPFRQIMGFNADEDGRRLFLLSADGERRPVMRSTERVDLGRPQQLARRLLSISERQRVEAEHDLVYGRAQAWVRPRAKGWPIIGRGRYSGVGSRAGTGPL